MTEYVFQNYIAFLLVFTRISGAILFNPFLGRKNIPAIVKVGLSLATAFLVSPTVDNVQSVGLYGVSFMAAAFFELVIGYMSGMLVGMITSFVVTAGEMSDTQLGLGMSKVYDPQSNVSMPVTGTIYNLMLTLIFFCMDGHLTLIRLIARSCEIFPPGSMKINTEVGSYIAIFFGSVLQMALKLALPVIAAEFIVEAGMGVLMRTVPQINVFVASLQLKLIIGLVLLILFLPTAAGIMGSSIDFMFEKLEDCMILMLG
ncbi:MAG: flagellar biosynthetic protein FliR [Clostridiaceae bacterium]|nr:flagellar biosynthetic protein FliR [Clostridiaceae bacterium]